MSDANGSGQEVVVLKIGGSVLTGTKVFQSVALFLKHRSELTPNERLVVVVSAQKMVTDTLERSARRIVSDPRVRVLDLLWSTGELHSVVLLALHLQAIGVSSTGLNVHEMADPGCELVQPQALLAASAANLPLVIRSMEQHAPVSLISPGSKSGRAAFRNEPVTAEV